MSDWIKQIQANLAHYAEQFRKSGDFHWVIRYAQEESLAREVGSVGRPKLYRPVELWMLRDVLLDQDWLDVDDLVQNTLNIIVGKLLWSRLARLPSNTAVLSNPESNNPYEAFIESVRPSKEEIADFDNLIRAEIRKNEDLNNEEKQALLRSLNDEQTILNAIDGVLALALAGLKNYNIWLNPILMFLPADKAAELVKNAAIPENKGARVSDLIKALKITSGHHANRIIQNRAKLTDPTYISDRSSIRFEIGRLSRYLVMLDAYIDFLERALAGLNQMMDQDPRNEWMRYGATGPFITRDPFIETGEDAPDSFGDFIRKAHDSVKINTKLWDGTEKVISKFQPPQNLIYGPYAKAEASKPDFSETLARKAQENLILFRQHNLEENYDRRLLELREIFSSLKTNREINRIYQDIVATFNAATLPPDPRLIEQVQDEDQDISQFMIEQEKIGDDPVKAYDLAQKDSFAKAHKELLDRYEPQSTIKGSAYIRKFGQFLEEILSDEIMVPTPADLRKLKGWHYELPSDPSVSSKGFKEFFPTTLGILRSNRFATVYAGYEKAMEEWEAAHSDPPDPIANNIADGLKALRNNPSILKPLGWHKEEFDLAARKELDEFSTDLDAMIEKVFSRNVSEISQLLGKIPLDAFYAYIGEQYIGVVEDSLACKIACRWGRAVKTQELKEDVGQAKMTGTRAKICKNCFDGNPPNPESIEEAKKFIRERFASTEIQPGKHKIEGLQTNLGSDTVGARVAHFHQLEKLREKGEEAKRGRFSVLATHYALEKFGGFLRDETRAKVRDFKEKNKQDAAKLGPSFRWDDPDRPRPRTDEELAHLVGAFADPIPSKKELGPSGKSFKRHSRSIEPGERFRPEELQQMVAAGEPMPDDIKKSLDRQIWATLRIGGGHVGNPVMLLQDAFKARKAEILRINPDYEQDIIEFKIDKPETKNPFAHLGLYATPSGEKREERAYIAAPEDLVKLINDNILSILAPHTADILKKKLEELYPKMNVVVWSSPRDAAKFFADNLADLIEEPGAADKLLKKIDPSFVRRLKPVEKAPEPVKKEEPAKPIATAPAVKSRKTIITEALNQALEKIDEILKARLEVKSENIDAQIRGWSQTRNAVEQQLVKHKDALKSIPQLDNLVELIHTRLRQLAQKIEDGNTRLLNAKQAEEEGKRQLLVDKIQKIIDVMREPASWPDEIISEASHILMSLVSGAKKDLVETSKITDAGRILDAYLTQLQRVKESQKKSPMSAKKTFDLELYSIEALKKQLQGVRIGEDYLIEEVSREDEPAVEYHEIGETPEE